jgi:hypothetical protein
MSIEHLSLGQFRDRRLEKGGRCCSNALLRAKAYACASSAKAVERVKSASVAFWPTRR